MAKGAKVLKYTSSESSENESDEDLEPSYSKLAKIAVKQQRAFEKVQNMLDKSDDMLGEEMDRTKALTENLQRLQSRFDNLQSHHNLSYLIMRSFLMNFFKESKTLRS